MKAENLFSLESRAYDGEMDVWSVLERQKSQCGFVVILVFRV